MTTDRTELKQELKFAELEELLEKAETSAQARAAFGKSHARFDIRTNTSVDTWGFYKNLEDGAIFRHLKTPSIYALVDHNSSFLYIAHLEK